jgi:hypothetical protein
MSPKTRTKTRTCYIWEMCNRHARPADPRDPGDISPIHSSCGVDKESSNRAYPLVRHRRLAKRCPAAVCSYLAASPLDKLPTAAHHARRSNISLTVTRTMEPASQLRRRVTDARYPRSGDRQHPSFSREGTSLRPAHPGNDPWSTSCSPASPANRELRPGKSRVGASVGGAREKRALTLTGHRAASLTTQ